MPTNRFLINPWQLHNVLGWSDFLVDNPDFFREVSIYPVQLTNYNSMTEKRLSLMAEASEETSGNVIQYRETDYFRNWEEVKKISGNLNNESKDEINYAPSSYLRIRLSKAGSDLVRWSGVSLSPRSNSSPWEVDYHFVREIEQEDQQDFENAREAPSIGIYW